MISQPTTVADLFLLNACGIACDIFDDFSTFPIRWHEADLSEIFSFCFDFDFELDLIDCTELDLKYHVIVRNSRDSNLVSGQYKTNLDGVRSLLQEPTSLNELSFSSFSGYIFFKDPNNFSWRRGGEIGLTRPEVHAPNAGATVSDGL